MSDDQICNYESVCRFCGLQKNYGKYLLSNDAITAGLITKIGQLFPPEVIFVEENDNLTKFVCIQCETTINYFCEFFSMVKSVQQLLRGKPLHVSCGDQNLCHTVDVLKNYGTINLCIESDGNTRCQCCHIHLDITQLKALNLSSQLEGSVFCCCVICAYKDEIKHFLNHETDKFQCPRCVYTFSGKQGTGYTCNEKKQHICDICNKSFRSKGHLNRHKLTHFNVKPFTCDVCGMKFSQKSVLKTHSFIHEQANPFNCKWCCQSFRHKTSLQEHTINFHGSLIENKNAYECSQCKKCFISKVKLERHYRSHSGEQPYKCYVCNKRFSQKTNLNTHSKKHAQNNQYSGSGNINNDNSNPTDDNNLYDTDSLLQSNQNEKYLREIFTNCEPLTLDSIQLEDNHFDSKITDNFSSGATAINEQQSRQSSPCSMFYDISPPSYTMYSSNDTNLVVTDDNNQINSKSSLLAAFCVMNTDTSTSNSSMSIEHEHKF